VTAPSAPQTLALTAGGSLAPHAFVPGRRTRLLVEFAALFIAMPVAITYLVRVQHLSLILLLQPVLIGLILFLLWDRSFSLKRELSRGFARSELKSIAAIFLAAGAALALFVWWFQPTQYLTFPRNRPVFWAAVMVLYPVFSAFPQELIYRTFFVHRYGPLFGTSRWLAIALNGALFGWAHIMFGNAISIVLSGLLGLLLAYRYIHARSFWAVWIEHSLYGQLIFTIGLGRYFFTGNPIIHN
jgi:membrane protease YdiL (CAAX protease family)